MMSEAYLRSRMEMSERSDLPAWLMNDELRGMGREALSSDAKERGKGRQKQPPRNGFWHLPRRKGVES